MAVPPYSYLPRIERRPISWPGGKKVAFYVGLNIEHFLPGVPNIAISSVSGVTLDPMNQSWRDYGLRVGIWRMIDLLDRCGLRASVLLNTDVCRHYPQVVRAGVERHWAWLGHGVTNSRYWSGMAAVDEGQLLDEIVRDIVEATGHRPKGWLGPAFTETENTLPLLAERGFTYSLDWSCDDLPYDLDVPGHRLLSVPYSAEMNDITAFIANRWTGAQFADAVIDHFEVLRREAREGHAAVMPLCLHPFLVNVPHRHRHLERIVEHIVACDDVWCTTTDEIADVWLANGPST